MVAAASEAASADAPPPESLVAASAEDVLREWDAALAALLAGEELDGLATALYTVGAPVRIDSLFDAYSAAAGTRRLTVTGEGGSVSTGEGWPVVGGQLAAGRAPDADEAAALSRALETLADLGVVELGTEENAGGLTVVLSPLGVWGVHRRAVRAGLARPGTRRG